MHFVDRTHAGKLLAEQLQEYKNQNAVVYAIPRGGVVTAVEIARSLQAPLDLIIAKKIGHPRSHEYAIAAVAENGHFVGTRQEIASLDPKWLENEIEKKSVEAILKRKKYMQGRAIISSKDKTAILVDDGVATGLTLRAGILALKYHHPKKIIVAIPVVPYSTARILKKEADELVSLEIPSEDVFLGSVGAYYDDFSQVSDEQVVTIIEEYRVLLSKEKSSRLPKIIDEKIGYDCP